MWNIDCILPYFSCSKYDLEENLYLLLIFIMNDYWYKAFVCCYYLILANKYWSIENNDLSGCGGTRL